MSFVKVISRKDIEPREAKAKTLWEHRTLKKLVARKVEKTKRFRRLG